MIRRVWIVCRPSARDAVNAALAPLAGGPEAVRAPLPRGTLHTSAVPQLYYAGWQGPIAEILSVRQALTGIAGVRVVPGMARGPERESDGEGDPDAGDAQTKRTRRGAIRRAAAALGIPLTNSESGG